jgi:hypothetical protein
MRECPRCHFVDPVYWRHPAFYPELDYLRTDDFETAWKMANEQYPVIPRVILEPQKYTIDEITRSAYYLSKTKKWTYRVWLPIYNAFGSDGGGAPHSKIRGSKFYDSAGRVNATAYGRLLKAMNQNRLPKNKLDQYLKSVVR